MKRALSIFTAGLMAAPVAIAQESAEGREVAELSRKEDVDFATEILPIFRKNCLACHNAKDADADLNLESPAAIAKGGESGPMVIPGNADKSQLMDHIRQTEKPFISLFRMHIMNCQRTVTRANIKFFNAIFAHIKPNYIKHFAEFSC